jgi:UPF0716 family protein affecting phage T7 exclusion
MNLETGKKAVGRIIRLTLAWLLIIGGIILMPTPILPGFVLLLPGLALLAAESRWFRRLLRRWREQRLVRRAIREAERAGIKIDLDSDEDGPEAGSGGH